MAFTSYYLDDDNDSAALAPSTHLAVCDQIQALSKKLLYTTEELHQQVRDKHRNLLAVALGAGRFVIGLSFLYEDVQRVYKNSESLKSQVGTQYQLVANQTLVLSRLHDLSHVLRSSGTLLSLTVMLKNTKDLLRQAEIHYELNQFIDDVEDLKNVTFIQSELAYIVTSKKKIRNLTQMQLVSGLKERKKDQVVTALKIFMNFKTLEKSLENLIATFSSELEQSLKECFAGNDISVITKSNESSKSMNSHTAAFSLIKQGSGLRGPGKTPLLTTTQNFRAKFWKSLHWLLYDELYEYCAQVKLLKSALEKINQYNFTVGSSDFCITQIFWKSVELLIKKSFNDCSQHITQTMQEGYSKLLITLRGFENRLNNEFLFDMSNFASLEMGYIVTCSANLRVCLSGVDLPTNVTIDNFIRVASKELSTSLIDDRLVTAVSSIFIACGKELSTKVESQIKLGADCKQVVDLPNLQQQQNILLANILYYYKDSTRRMLLDLRSQFQKLSTQTYDNIANSFNQVDLLIGTILQKIMESIVATINIILLSIHREPGLNTDKITANGPSMYIKEFQDFITRTWPSHIEPFDDKEMIKKYGTEVAKRCIELFIHNVCILRPVSIAGRQRIKNDCYCLEQALAPICPNLSELGKFARLLRAMSILIVQHPKELVNQTIGNDSLVPSYIVLMLLFGYASTELQSPHTTANWSNERLVEWLVRHTSERERLELISGALQRYRDVVKRRNNQLKYDEIYPLMVEFFERAMKTIYLSYD